MNKKHEKSFRKFIMKNIKGVSILTTICLVIFPVIVFNFLQFLEVGDVNTAFSNIMSCAGIISSGILAIITLYITVIFDDYNNKSAEESSRLSIATNMPNMICKNMNLYSLSVSDHHFDYLKMFNEKNNFILELEMEPAFPPYFKVELLSMQIELKKVTTGERLKYDRVALDTEDYKIFNNKNFQAIINIPEKINEPTEFLYKMKTLAIDGIPPERTIVDIWIEFKCENVLLKKSLPSKMSEIRGYDGDVSFRLHFKVENEGKNGNQSGVRLKIINRQFESVI